MEEMIYPSANFLRRAKKAINLGSMFDVRVLEGKQKQILLSELPDLLEENNEKKRIGIRQNWLFIPNMFRVLSFFTAYLYAKSAGYEATFTVGKDLTVHLRPRMEKR